MVRKKKLAATSGATTAAAAATTTTTTTAGTMNKHAEMYEGQAAFNRFRKAVKAVMSVPKSALPPRPHRTKKKAAKRKA